MPLFSTAQLAMMQGVQERHMQDEGWIYAYAPASVNAYNLPVAAYTRASKATPCGFKPASNEVQRSGEHWVVAGPTGIYTVGRAESDPARDAERTSSSVPRARTSVTSPSQISTASVLRR